MTPFAEVRIPVNLDRDAKGKFIPRTLVFNLVTMSAYEEATRTAKHPEGKFYWDTVLAIFDVYAKYGPKLLDGETVPSAEEIRRSSTDILRRIHASDIHLFVWAALHEYAGDEPKWPLTLAQVGRLIGTWDTIPMLGLIVKGIQNNSPTQAELGEAKGAGPQLVAEPPAEVAQTAAASGGEASIELPADAFA